MKVWVSLKEFPQYEASNEGDIRNKKTGRILKQKLGVHDRYQVSLFDNGRSHTKQVHRLIADSFFDGNHEGLDVDHVDGDHKNNHISNLEFCTRKENTRRAFELGLRVGPRRKRIILVETGEVFDSIRDCQRMTGFDHSAISKCLSGKQDNYKGYHFEEID